MKKGLLLLLAFTSSYLSYSQKEQNEEKESIHHAVGLAAGATTGFGFSYEIDFGKIRTQITGIPVYNDNREIYSIGIAPKYEFNNSLSSTVFYGYVGAHYLRVVEKYLYYNYGPCYYDSYGNYICQQSTQNVITENLNIGFGGGADFQLLPNLSFQLMAGYGFYTQNSRLRLTTITAELGFFVKFR